MVINNELIDEININTKIPNYYHYKRAIEQLGDATLICYATPGTKNTTVSNLKNYRGLLFCCGYGYNIQASYLPMSVFIGICGSHQFNIVSNTYNQGMNFVGIKYVNDTTIQTVVNSSFTDNVVRVYGIY